MRGATYHVFFSPSCLTIFQSTPPVRGATNTLTNVARELGISIHAPRAGGDRPGDLLFIEGTKFQSTPPVRGATSPLLTGSCGNRNFNPRPPCGGRQKSKAASNCSGFPFQSTPPVRGATGFGLAVAGKRKYFNPRPPCGGRRRHGLAYQVNAPISIHAPRAGGDKRKTQRA